MELDRNINSDGLGKYALINLRRLKNLEGEVFGLLPIDVTKAIETLDKAGLIDWGRRGAPDEFFVIKLRDIFAPDALLTYAKAAIAGGDKQFGGQVWDLAARAGALSPHAKRPD